MKARKLWIGRWLIAVAMFHTIAGVFMGSDVLTSIFRRGIVDSVGQDAMTGAFVWFFLFGAILALLGMVVHTLEQADRFKGARALGIWTSLMTLVGVVLMPASGFWLLFPAGIGLMRRGN